MRAPAFWQRPSSPIASLLRPAGFVYGMVAGRRMGRMGERAGAPVVCIGNFTAGGAGKTPTALAVAKLLIEAGERPVFLTRGYGGRLARAGGGDPPPPRAPGIRGRPPPFSPPPPPLLGPPPPAGG